MLELRPDLPAGIDEVLATGMAKEKEERYPYCVALARGARSALLGRGPTPAAGVTPPEPTRAVEAPPVFVPPVVSGESVTVPAPPPMPPTGGTPPGGSGTQTTWAGPPPSGSGMQAPPLGGTGAPPDDGGGRRRAIGVLVGAVVAAGLALGGFLVFSGGDDDGQDATGATGETAIDASGPTGQQTGATGATGAVTGPTGGTGDPDVLSLAEAHVLGAWDLTFSPEGDASAGSATNTVWEMDRNCEARTGAHPCDVDVRTPVTGFLQRQGKFYDGVVSGELPCGPGVMRVRFEVVDAEVIDGPWRAVQIRGEGTILSGGCQDAVFTLVGTLP